MASPSSNVQRGGQVRPHPPLAGFGTSKRLGRSGGCSRKTGNIEWHRLKHTVFSGTHFFLRQELVQAISMNLTLGQ